MNTQRKYTRKKGEKMKLYDPSGSKETININITMNEIKTLVFAKYEEQARNIVAQIRNCANN